MQKKYKKYRDLVIFFKAQHILLFSELFFSYLGLGLMSARREILQVNISILLPNQIKKKILLCLFIYRVIS